MGEFGPFQLDAATAGFLLRRADGKQPGQVSRSLGEPCFTLLHAYFADELGRLSLVVKPVGQLALLIEGKLGGRFSDPEQLAPLEVVTALPLQLALLVHDGHGYDDGGAIDPGLDLHTVMTEQTGIEGALGTPVDQGELLRKRSGQRR